MRNVNDLSEHIHKHSHIQPYSQTGPSNRLEYSEIMQIFPLI